MQFFLYNISLTSVAKAYLNVVIVALLSLPLHDGSNYKWHRVLLIMQYLFCGDETFVCRCFASIVVQELRSSKLSMSFRQPFNGHLLTTTAPDTNDRRRHATSLCDMQTCTGWIQNSQFAGVRDNTSVRSRMAIRLMFSMLNSEDICVQLI